MLMLIFNDKFLKQDVEFITGHRKTSAKHRGGLRMFGGQGVKTMEPVTKCNTSM